MDAETCPNQKMKCKNGHPCGIVFYFIIYCQFLMHFNIFQLYDLNKCYV